MGTRAIRITREEVLTPPEFAGLESIHHPAGRVGGARIELVQSGNATRLGSCYQQIPVRVLPPFVFGSEHASLLYVINLTAGLMDGDIHHLEIVARSGTQAVITGQSATRIHPALKSFASQQWTIDVEDDACLVVLPGPNIPFAGCKYYQRGRVNLAPRAKLIWGDIWLPGRYERAEISERFQFNCIVQDFEARRAGELIYRDRFRWDGPWSTEEASWYFGGELACGSLFIGGPLPDSLPEPNPAAGRSVFPLGTEGTCFRWCGDPSAVTTDLVSLSMHIAAAWKSGPQSPPWLLNSSSLSPNHWFMSADDWNRGTTPVVAEELT
ncbi:urease accessory protein UreD [Schlesneria sp. T3-172]|uniref:urease accessory protein UreD n=1 Tax=Schlesneria sphaerica TaxID=3373610 RepID=UPI0037C77343